MPHPKLLAGKTALVLNPAGLLELQICLTLALEGCNLVGIGPAQDELRAVQREIVDLGASFDGLAGNSAAEAAQICAAIPPPDFIINPVGVYAACPAPPAGQLRLDVERARDLCLALLAERERAHPHAPPARYLDVALSGAAPAPVRMSRLYLPADASPGLPADRLWPVAGVANIPPGLVAAELLNLLANPAYRPAAGVSLRTSGQTVEAHLHPPGPDGTPNPGATIQKHVRGRVFHVFIRPSVFGKTVCAAKDFQRGEPVIATNGREIDHQTEHSFQIGWNRHFEADFPARGINHSCQPTLGVKTNALGAPDFVAFTPIKAGQELTFDYAMTEFTHYPRQNPTLEFSLTCTCGAKTCRGKLGYYSELPPHIKKKYAGFISDYLTAAPQS